MIEQILYYYTLIALVLAAPISIMMHYINEKDQRAWTLLIDTLKASAAWPVTILVILYVTFIAPDYD